ncbi:pyridoxal biosynthesis lyase PdxS [Paenarthrobacter nitroguajacolicus]|nr:pyridoxal biosynthesis lyase PdxS [Paenarthrobacter nitroguajacolicus]
MTTRDPLLEHIRFTGGTMAGSNVDEIPQPHRLAERGW